MNKKQFFGNFTGFIQRALKFNELKARNGLSSLEEYLEDLDDEYFKHGMRMVVDGVNAVHIDEILSNILAFEKDKYSRRYKTIVKRAVLGIQEGLSTRILAFVLMSLAGLPKDEQRKVEYIVYRDPPDEPAEPDPTAGTEGEKFEISGLRQWYMACEDIEYKGLEKGVVFGNSKNRVIIITDECQEPDQVKEILAEYGGIKVHQDGLDLDCD